MTGFAFFPPSFVLVNSSGRPYAGAVARFYRASTSTPLSVYSTAALSTALGTSVTADAAGVFPPVFIDPTGGDYKVSFFTSGGSLIRTVDNLPATYPLTAGQVGTALYPRTTEEISAGVTPSEYAYPPGDVRRYGAVGDGVTDDTSAINQAATVAAISGELYFPPGYIFGISGFINILNGTKLVHGDGKILCLNNGNTVPSGILLKGKENGAAANVSGCRLDGLYIDRNGQWSVGIYLSNSDNCQVTNCRIVNGTSGHASDYPGIYAPSFASSTTGAHDLYIANNYIEGDETTAVAGGADGISVQGRSTYTAPHTDFAAQWKALFTLPATGAPAYNIVIANNQILGGYYGIALGEARYCTVTGNNLTNNIRNISVQANSLGNLIEGNLCRESNSSAVHLAYGSCDNTIKGNKAYSSRAQGQAIFNAYIACDRNVFDGNHSYTTVLDPTYHIYCAIHSDYNVFRNNTVGGTAARAYIAIESAWDTSVANEAHLVYGESDPSVEDFANAASTYNTIEGNTIVGVSAVPAIFLAQVDSDTTVCALTGTRVVGNKVIGNGYNYQLALYEDDSGSLSDTVICDNDFDAAATSAKFLLPRGRAHCATVANNTVLDRGSATTTFTGSDATPDVSLGRVFKTADTTTYTDFDGGVDGQEFWLVADHAATVTDNANIKTSTGSSKTLSVGVVYKFLSVGGVWYEQATA